MKMKICVSALGLASLILTGCGTSVTPAKLNDSGGSVNPLIVVMGGFTTCGTQPDGRVGPRGMALYRPFQELVQNVRDRYGVESDYVISCFDSDQPVHYYTSSEPDTLKSESYKSFYESVAAARVNHPKTYLIGHSHGGWLAMKTVLEAAEGYPFDGVYTIDPISRINCTPSWFLDCTRAPSDIGGSMRARIKDDSERWENYYQTQTLYLHSAPMAEADENVKVNAVHTMIDQSPLIWSSVKALVTKAL